MNLSIDWSLLFIGILKLLITLIMGVFVVFIGYKAFTMFTKEMDEIDELKKNNVSVGIMSGSIIMSMAILLQSATAPSITTIRLLLRNGVNFMSILLSVGFFILFFVVAGIIALLVIILSSTLYNKLTKSIDELIEIKNNNIAIAIAFSAVIVGISLIVKDGVNAIILGLQPWPEMPTYEDIPTKVGFIKNALNFFI